MIDGILDFIGRYLEHIFPKEGSWQWYIFIGCMWLVAVGSLLGMALMVYEWISKLLKKLFKSKS